MSEAKEQVAPETNIRRLADTIREVKNAYADRDDVVVELREVTRTRMEMLAAELESVIADAPSESPAFDFAISSGAQPRFWVDAVAHVSLARDRRTYRFVRDTRNGRIVLAESTDIKPIADAVTRYVAERIVERQRDLDAGPQPVTTRPEEPKSAEPVAAAAMPRASEPPRRDRAAEFLSTLALVAFGGIVGAAITILVLRERFPEIQSLF
jgi:hypothetical protein